MSPTGRVLGKWEENSRSWVVVMGVGGAYGATGERSELGRIERIERDVAGDEAAARNPRRRLRVEQRPVRMGRDQADAAAPGRHEVGRCRRTRGQ